MLKNLMNNVFDQTDATTFSITTFGIMTLAVIEMFNPINNSAVKKSVANFIM